MTSTIQSLPRELTKVVQRRLAGTSSQHSTFEHSSADLLDHVYQNLCEIRKTFIGYPVNQSFEYTPIYRFFSFSGNNYGDPFHPSNFGLNTHDVERIVVSAFAQLLNTSLAEAWGYVTSGTTESHISSLSAAREKYPNGVVYYSCAAHSSVAKVVWILGMQSVQIPSQKDGEMDYSALELSLLQHKTQPAIVIVNIGTTMTGAIDSLPKIREILHRVGLLETYLHADAALSGMILPFVESPQPFRFSDGLDSIAISGHKMIGSPVPCGVVLVRREHISHLQDAGEVEYVRCRDTTIASSRSAISPLILYWALRTKGVLNQQYQLGDATAMRQMVRDALNMAEYAIRAMRRKGIPAWRHANSLTIVFPRTSSVLEKRWYLASSGEISHMITMPGITTEQIDHLVADLGFDAAVENGSMKNSKPAQRPTKLSVAA